MQETVEEPQETEAGKRVRRTGLSAWMRLPSRARLATVIFLLCLFVYTLLLFLVPHYKGMPTTDGDEPHYLLITQSILSDGDLNVINNYKSRQYDRYYEDDIPNAHVTKGRGGRRVSTHPPFLSIVLLPGFWLFGHEGAAFTMIVLTGLAAAFAFLLADRFTHRTVAAGVTLFLFFTYPLIFYARLIYPETAALFLVAFGTWATWRLKESGGRVYAALAGLSAGLLLLFHPKFFALSLALLAAFFMVGRKDRVLLKWWLLPAAACFGLLLVLTYLTYGPNLLKGLTASGGSKLVGGYWGTNSVWGIPGLFLDRAWGLFIFAPLYLVFPLGLSLQNNRLEWTRWWAFFPLCIGLHVLVLGTFQSWDGGTTPVPRYLVPVASLMVIGVTVFMERCRSRPARATAALFALLQIVTTVWAFRFMVGAYGLVGRDNVFLAHFIDNGWLEKFPLSVFPLFHPAGAGSVLLTLMWVFLFAVTIYAARRSYMRLGGGKLSPVLDIRPF